MKKVIGLLAICLLLFGCVGDADTENQTNSSIFEGSPEINPEDIVPAGEGFIGGDSESSGLGVPDGSPMWAGTFSIRVYGGGKEKAYDMTLTGADELYFDSEENAFDVLKSTYTCTYTESSDIESMAEGMPSMTMSRTGSGTITKEYGEDEFRLYFENDGSITGDFSEPNEDWVDFSVTANFGSSDSWTEEGGCLIDNFNDVYFEAGTFEEMTLDELGRDSMSGQKIITSGTANMDITFEYHRVGE